MTKSDAADQARGRQRDSLPVLVSSKRISLGLVTLTLVALAGHFLPDNDATLVAFKLVSATLAVGLVPGVLVLMLARPLTRFGFLELVGLGIPVSIGLIQVLTLISLLLHLSAVAVAFGAAATCAAAALFLCSRAKVPDALELKRGEIGIFLLLAVLALFLYLAGSPCSQIEDQIHVSVIRRLSILARPAIDNIYIVRGMIYTYPFPGTHFFFALVSRLAGLDPLFVYQEMRFFWGPATITLLCLMARVVFGQRAVLPTVVAVTGVVFAFNGVFAGVPNYYWAQLVPYSHVSDVAMNVILPGLLVLALYFLSSRNRRAEIFFFLGALLLALMLVIVHIREIVQFMVYMGSFLLALLVMGHRRLYLRKTLFLIAGTAALAVGYLGWYRSVVGHVDSLVGLRKVELQGLIRSLQVSDWLAVPIHLLDKQHLFSSDFDPFFHGWNPIILLASPWLLWVYRRQLWMLLVGSSILVYMLIVRFPIFAVPYIYATYFEILKTPVRNVVFFIYLLTGALFYWVAVRLAGMGDWRMIAAGSAGTLVVSVAMWNYAGEFFKTHIDLLFMPVIGSYLIVFVCLLMSKSGGQMEELAPPPRPAWRIVFVVLLFAMAWWTFMPSSSLLAIKPQGVSLTPGGLLGSLPCASQACPPNSTLVQWATTSLPADSVFAISIQNWSLPSYLLPQQITAWPGSFAGDVFNRNAFPEYYKYYDRAQARHESQPFFNARDSLGERLEFVRALHVSHILVDPAIYSEMKAVLSQWQQVFKPVYDDGQWMVYSVQGS